MEGDYCKRIERCGKQAYGGGRAFLRRGDFGDDRRRGIFFRGRGCGGNRENGKTHAPNPCTCGKIREKVLDILHKEGVCGWKEYPRDAKWHIDFHEQLNRQIKKYCE